jgi:ELWxxDGT repeat protein
VFDARVPDLSTLLGAVVEGAECYVLSQDEDAVLVITQLLASTGAKQLALIAHGDPGMMHLGAYPLDRECLLAQSRLLQEWGVAEIALYGCEVAKDETGRAFVAQLSELTGAIVTASETPVGNGQWALDITSAEAMAVGLPFMPAMLSHYTATLSSVQFDIESGSGSSDPSNLTNVNGTLYFTATNSSNGRELWKIDSNTGNPVLFSDIELGSGSSGPDNLTNVNGTLYFSASTSTNGNELWKIDPSTGSPVRVTNILSGIYEGQGGISDLININGTLYFSAVDRIVADLGSGEVFFGSDLWKVDPSTGNPVLLDLGSVSSEVSEIISLTNFNGTLYIYTTDYLNLEQLWKIDSATGTPLLIDLSFLQVLNQTHVNGVNYFVSYDISNQYSGQFC